MNSRILNTVTLVLVMLVTGVFWGTWFTLTRSIDEFPPDNFIRIGKTIIDNVAWPMRILMPATLLSLLWLCIVTKRYRPSFYFFVTSFILMVIALVITVVVEVPIDNQIKTWTTETLPENLDSAAVAMESVPHHADIYQHPGLCFAERRRGDVFGVPNPGFGARF